MLRHPLRIELIATILTLTALLALMLGAHASRGAQSPVVIKMLDTPPSFEPRTVIIKVGDTVEWDNVGGAVHHATDDHEMAITSDDVVTPKNAPIFDSGFLRPGEKFTHTFTVAGAYKYVCVAHEASGMTGEIIVR